MQNPHLLPPGFRFVFFEGDPNYELELLLRDSAKRISFEEDGLFITFGGIPIQLMDITGFRDYEIEPGSLEMYLTTNVPNYAQKSPQERRVDQKLATEQILSAAKRNPSGIYTKRYKKNVYFDPEPLYKGENAWVGLLIDTNINKVVGIYQGEYETSFPSLDIYSANSFIEIRPDYRGRGLCIPFAALTYETVMKRAKSINIVNASRPRSKGCSCYVRAAEEIGATTYENGNILSSMECKKRPTKRELRITRG